MIDIDGFREYLIQRGYTRETIELYYSTMREYSQKYDEIIETNLAAYVKSLHECGLALSTIERKKIALRKYCGFIGVPIGETLRQKKQDGRRIHKKTELDQKPKPTPKKTLEEVVSEIERYNEEHGTRLTYGKYKVLQKQGRI